MILHFCNFDILLLQLQLQSLPLPLPFSPSKSKSKSKSQSLSRSKTAICRLFDHGIVRLHVNSTPLGQLYNGFGRFLKAS